MQIEYNKAIPGECDFIPHIWVVVPPISLYDTLYRCVMCGKTHMESIDNQETTKPENGCAASPPIPREGTARPG